MLPQSPGEYFVQGCMYIAGIGGSIYTYVHDEHFAAAAIFVLTALLLISNLILNALKIKQFRRTGSTKPSVPVTKLPPSKGKK